MPCCEARGRVPPTDFFRASGALALTTAADSPLSLVSQMHDFREDIPAKLDVVAIDLRNYLLSSVQQPTSQVLPMPGTLAALPYPDMESSFRIRRGGSNQRFWNAWSIAVRRSVGRRFSSNGRARCPFRGS